MLERRRYDRSRDFAAGTIADGRSRVTLPCVVRNLSAGGALLLLDEPRRAPVEMELALRDGTRPARVVWRNETEIGVAFAAASPAPSLRALPSTVVCLDAVRRERARGSDERRLAQRIARFVRPAGRPAPR